MIPKKIHYCWFGNNKKTDLIEYCINSWKEYLPDYEIIEWNDDNFDFSLNNFLEKAYENKKWAFVSDYVRAYVLYKYGGIYLDTDVEIKQNLDIFLIHRAFSGFETYGFPFTALWGSVSDHIWPKKVLEYYDDLNDFNSITNTVIVTNLLVNEFGVNPFDDRIQFLKEDIVIYPSHFFCLDLNQNFASHHFNGSWLNSNVQVKKRIHRNYYFNSYKNILDNNIVQDLIDNNELNFKDTFSFFFLNIIKILKIKIHNIIFSKKTLIK
jgi:hypothetical protein